MKEQEKKTLTDQKVCPNCGNEFLCSSSGKCWCFEVYVSPERLKFIQDNFDSCLCPECLKTFSKE